MIDVRLENLTYCYPGAPACALRNVSFEVSSGETLALIGPNGAGKSTLLLHLNGILQGTGTLEVLGQPLNRHTLKGLRTQVGLVFQDPNDQLFMPTVRDDVAFGPLNQGFSRQEVADRVQSTLEAVGLSEKADSAPHRLSLGERKRAALACVLAMDCKLLVLDEPATGLDPAGEDAFIRLLAAQSLTTLIATHNMELAWLLADRVGVMDAGQIVALGPARVILQNESLLKAHKLRPPRNLQEKPLHR